MSSYWTRWLALVVAIPSAQIKMYKIGHKRNGKRMMHNEMKLKHWPARLFCSEIPALMLTSTSSRPDITFPTSHIYPIMTLKFTMQAH